MMELSYFLFWWDKNINLRLKKKKEKNFKIIVGITKGISSCVWFLESNMEKL